MLPNISLVKQFDLYLGEILEFKFQKYEKIFRLFMDIIKGFEQKNISENLDKIRLNVIKFVNESNTKLSTKDEFYSIAGTYNEPISDFTFINKVIESDVYYIIKTFNINVNDVLQTASPPTNDVNIKKPKIVFNNFLFRYSEQIANSYWRMITYIIFKMLENAHINIGGKTFGTDGTGWIALPNSTWSNPATDPLKEINDRIVALINHDFFTNSIETAAPVVIMGSNAWDLFRNNPNVNDKLLRYTISAYDKAIIVDNLLSEQIIYHPIDLAGGRIRVIVVQGKIKDPFSNNMVDLWNPNRILILRPVEGNIVVALGSPATLDTRTNQIVLKKGYYSIDQAIPPYPQAATSIMFRFSAAISAVIAEPTLGGTFLVS